MEEEEQSGSFLHISKCLEAIRISGTNLIGSVSIPRGKRDISQSVTVFARFPAYQS